MLCSRCSAPGCVRYLICCGFGLTIAGRVVTVWEANLLVALLAVQFYVTLLDVCVRAL
jgi:hypothetical protein